jgi:hypothetical protein
MSRETKNCRKKCCCCCKPKPPKPCLSLSEESSYTLNFQEVVDSVVGSRVNYLKNNESVGILKDYFNLLSDGVYKAKYSCKIEVTGQFVSYAYFTMKYQVGPTITIIYNLFEFISTNKTTLPYCFIDECKKVIPATPDNKDISTLLTITEGSTYYFGYSVNSTSQGDKYSIPAIKCCDIKLVTSLPLNKYFTFYDENITFNGNIFTGVLKLRFFEPMSNKFYIAEKGETQLKILSDNITLKISINSFVIELVGKGEGKVVLSINKNSQPVKSYEESFTTESTSVNFNNITAIIGTVAENDIITFDLKFGGDLLNEQLTFNVRTQLMPSAFEIQVDNTNPCP